MGQGIGVRKMSRNVPCQSLFYFASAQHTPSSEFMYERPYSTPGLGFGLSPKPEKSCQPIHKKSLQRPPF